MTTHTIRMRHWCLGVGLMLAGVVIGSAPPVEAEMPRAVFYDAMPAAPSVGAAQGTLAAVTTELTSSVSPEPVAGACIDIQTHQIALGDPTPRVDVVFQ